LGERDFSGESDDSIIAGVNLEERSGLGADRLLIILPMCTVGRADLAELRPALGEHFGNSERSADLDQLAARDHHLLAFRQIIEREQYGGGVVVDDRRSLPAGQRPQVLPPRRIPITPSPPPAARP